MRFLEISKIVQDNNFFDGYDEDLHCPILDEDKVSKYFSAQFVRIA